MDYHYPDLEQPPNYLWLGRSGAEVIGDVGPEPPTYDDDVDVADDVGRGSRFKGFLSDDSFSDPDFEPGNEDESDDDHDDDDDEYYTLQPAVATYQERLQRPRKGQARVGVDEPGWKKGGKRGPRGPRKPVEPSIEIKLLLAQANDAFIIRDYDKAEELATRVILMNAEIYAAHVLLSGVFLERGDTQLGIVAQMSAAHLRPKDPVVWRNCIDLILEKGREHRESYLKDAVYCYTRIIQLDPKDFESRFQKAMLLCELDLKGRAARQLEEMLDMLPRDTTVLRQLAEVYIDLGEVEKAKRRYRAHIELARASDEIGERDITWSDVNIFVELFDYDRQYLEGIEVLKSLSRWLLGREAETFWDAVRDDDREWDSDDVPRRILTEGFCQGRHGRAAYGDGLPLELRVKLGMYRLKGDPNGLEEALAHFEWLEPQETSAGAKLWDYADLFRDVADALHDQGHLKHALRFFEPVLKTGLDANPQIHHRMATCYQHLGLVDDAEKCFKMVLQLDEPNVDARVQLARIYEAQGKPEQAVVYVNEVIALEAKRHQEKRAKRRRIGVDPPVSEDADAFLPPSRAPRTSQRRKASHVGLDEQQQAEQAQEDAIRMQLTRVEALEGRMQSGDEAATDQWMEVAGAMIEDFRHAKIFYPMDRYIRFLGYSREARAKASRPNGTAMTVIQALGERLQAALDQRSIQPEESEPIPTSYRGIEFSQWLDIFLKYALCLARRGEKAAAYEIVGAAGDANVYYHSRDALFLIHACWAACALRFDDDEIVCTAARWFTKEFQFTTDGYRLHAALNRLCQGSNSWYNSGPSQKFVLRQVKAMDYALVGDECRAQHFAEKASYTTRDAQGGPIVNEDMDIALLMLYGHMLYSGTSYSFALNYFFRAYALDPTNVMIQFFIGLSYVQYALKRQSANRHFHILQGLSFLFAYYEVRQKSSVVEERQEAEFNLGRVFHMLGLTHLALPYYERVLQLSETMSKHRRTEPPQVPPRPRWLADENFAQDAAYNLQNIYFMSGNLTMAKEVTEKYLVI